jgi:hypothetical protein
VVTEGRVPYDTLAERGRVPADSRSPELADGHRQAAQARLAVLWPAQDAAWGRFVVLADPDGRPVVLARMNRPRRASPKLKSSAEPAAPPRPRCASAQTACRRQPAPGDLTLRPHCVIGAGLGRGAHRRRSASVAQGRAPTPRARIIGIHASEKVHQRHAVGVNPATIALHATSQF